MARANPEDQINVNKSTLEIILGEYGISDFDFEVFKLGIANTSIKIITPEKSFVLRIYCHGKKSDENIITESKFQDYLRERGILIPLIYPNQKREELSHVEVDGRVWQIVLMEYKDGLHKEGYTDNILIELAQTQAKMHLLGIEFAKGIKKHERTITEIWDTMAPAKGDVTTPSGTSKSIDQFMQRAKAMHIKVNPELPHGYNHLDLDLGGNILVKDDKIDAILDFDDLSYSACVICLAYTLWHILFTTNDLNKVNFYLKEYIKVRKLTELELKTLPEMMLFRNYVLGIVQFFLHKNYDNVEKIVKQEKPIMSISFEQFM